jgi:hypothetical protein
MPATAALPRSSATKADKAENTTKAAQLIMSAEVDARELKTKKLREARLAKEAADAANVVPAAPAKRKTRARA